MSFPELEEKANRESQGPSAQDFVIRDGFPAFRLPLANKSTAEDSHAANQEHTTHTDGMWNLDAPEPLPRFPIWAQEDALAFCPSHFDKLVADCASVFSARTRDDDQAYSAGVTYFLPAVMKPRCGLESLVQDIFKQHTRDLPDGVMLAEQSGAEWWTLVLDDEDKDEVAGAGSKSAGGEKRSGCNSGDEEEEDEGDEVGLHFDADYGLEDQATNLLLHPRLATVTYLSSTGAPTFVLDQKSPPPNDPDKKSLDGSVITTAWLSHPAIGKHLAFDGRLLHGAPATFFPGTSGGGGGDPSSTRNTHPGNHSDEPPPSKKAKLETPRRITLLVNIWINHCPLDAEPLDNDFCATLKTPWQASTGKTDESWQSPFQWNKTNEKKLNEPTVTNKVNLVPSKEDPAGEEEFVIGDRIITLTYGAKMESLHHASRKDGLVELRCAEGVMTLSVGDKVPDDEEDDLN